MPGKFDPTSNGVHYTLIRRESSQEIGSFSRTAGILASFGLEIQRAQIERVDPFAWNDFWVVDPDHPQETVPDDRILEVSETLEALMNAPDEPLPPPRQVWNVSSQEPDSVNVLPSKVTFDNETIDHYTILSLFAYDSPGLLHRVTDAIAKQNLVLHFAKIDTHFDQVADVFYISEVDDSRLLDRDRQQRVRDAVLSVLGESKTV